MLNHKWNGEYIVKFRRGALCNHSLITPRTLIRTVLKKIYVEVSLSVFVFDIHIPVDICILQLIAQCQRLNTACHLGEHLSDAISDNLMRLLNFVLKF